MKKQIEQVAVSVVLALAWLLHDMTPSLERGAVWIGQTLSRWAGQLDTWLGGSGDE